MEVFTKNDWVKFKEGKLAVHITSYDLSKEFLTELLINGITNWIDGDAIDPNKPYWTTHRTNSCYGVECNLLFCEDIEYVEIESIKEYKGMAISNELPIKKIYNQLEIIQEFFKNPKIRVKQIKDILGTPIEEIIWYINEYGVIESTNGLMAIDTSKYDKCEYEIIIEPKQLKQMSFAEAMKHYIWATPITSCLTNKTFTKENKYNDCTKIESSVADEEIDGLWTVEGVYEDVE